MPDNKLLQKQREDIIKTLKWFNLSLSKQDQSKLEQDNAIVFSDYLDKYLIPLIPTLFKSKEDTDDGQFWPREQNIQFRGLVSLCFQGTVSMKVWDKIWLLFSEKEQILYSTTDYHLGRPLSIAAKNSNLNALKRLDLIYDNLLNKYPDRTHLMHLDLRTALIECELAKDDECFSYLLNMSEKYSKSTDISKHSLSDKKMNYQPGLFIQEGSTSLLEFYSDIAVDYLRKLSFHHFVLLCSHLSKIEMTAEEYQQFRNKIIPVLNDSMQQYSHNEKMLEKLHYVEEKLNNLEKSIGQEKVLNQKTTDSVTEPLQPDEQQNTAPKFKRKGSEEQYELLINEQLLPLTKNYLKHLEEAKNSLSHEDKSSFKEKYQAIQNALDCLENKEKRPSAFDRVGAFYSTLNKHTETIIEHRDPRWKRYIKNVLIAGGILITGILPGLALLLVYANIGNTAGKSLQFWKSGGQAFLDKTKNQEPLNQEEEPQIDKESKSLK